MSSVRGQQELASILAEARHLLRAAILFSAVVNLLMLTSPLFMMQVYDRVLSSRSEETLWALVLLMTLLFVLMAMLDLARARLMARYALRAQQRLEARVFAAVLDRGGASPGYEVVTSGRALDPSAARPATPESASPAHAFAHLDAFTKFYASPGFLALVDLPWVPVFLAATTLFHPWLGLLALAGGAVLVAVTLLNQRASQMAYPTLAREGQKAQQISDALSGDAEVIRALGMEAAIFSRWQSHRQALSRAALWAADQAALWTVVGRNLRLYLQSAMLALAALLVLRGEASGGVMVAAAVLTGRALAPVDQLLAAWPMLVRARAGREGLAALLRSSTPSSSRLPLPRPEAKLRLNNLTLSLPGLSRPALSGVTLELSPGQALAVIGASGSGKSTLARCLTGGLTIAPQMLHLGGAPLASYGADLGRNIGYLPQQVTLFDGTIAENIARMASPPDAAAVLLAAEHAGLREDILGLPQGFETQISARVPRLSGGQIQRIGLARTLHGDPVLLVLDEPDSNLDHEGAEALSAAVRRCKAGGKLVVIMAHRPAAIRDCDFVLILEAGRPRAFGPAAEVLRSLLRPAGPTPADSAQPQQTEAKAQDGQALPPLTEQAV